jgi:hypothetical protein
MTSDAVVVATILLLSQDFVVVRTRSIYRFVVVVDACKVFALSFVIDDS